MIITKKIAFLFLTVLLLTLTACGRKVDAPESSTQQEATKEDTNIETEKEPEILKYVDAKGNWHETEILDNVKKHSYNWDCLINDESGISYEGDENYTIRKGIDVSKTNQFGNGLKNMRRRMEDLGIEFSIENKNGTLITLRRIL